MILETPHLNLEDIMQSGQCFRMNRLPGGCYLLIAGSRAVKIRALGDHIFELDCSQPDFDTFWARYFDLSTDYGKIISSIPRDDDFLTRAAAWGKDLRILRQDPWEMLITFILSQRKSIPAIRGCVEGLCARFGAPMENGLYAFPTPQSLAQADESQLRDCALGYRAPYVLKTARMIAGGQCNLDSLAALDDQALLGALMQLPGVGVKVASCVMLFGYHRLSAAPVDVWIQKVIDEHYGGQNPFNAYGPWAGVMQQYMFFYRRALAAQKGA